MFALNGAKQIEPCSNSRKPFFHSRECAMPLIGSFCLLLALVLALYCFVAGILAMVTRHPAAARLGETARRAGMASFIATAVSALTLVWAALSNDFSLAYIKEHTNRA